MNLLEANVSSGSDRPVARTLLLVSLVASLFWAGLALVDPSGQAAGASLVSPLYRAAQLVLVFLMWAGLCTAMMLPLASRAAVLFARLAGHSAAQRARLCTFLFVLAYLLSWAGFALLATILQWTLDDDARALRHPPCSASRWRRPAFISGHRSSTPAWRTAGRRCPASWPAGATACRARSGAARRMRTSAWDVAGC